MRSRGFENIPSTGPAIIVCNHVSHIDPLLIGRFLVDAGRSPHFLAKREAFTGFPGVVLRAAEQIPVDREGTPGEAFQAASAALRAGQIVVIMPEGTITRDPEGMPGPLKTGAARLAQSNPDVPVVLISQWGVQRSINLYHKRFRLFPRIRHFVTAHPPLEFDDDLDVAARTAMIAELLVEGIMHHRDSAYDRGHPDKTYL